MPSYYIGKSSSASCKCSAAGCTKPIIKNELRLGIMSSAGNSNYRHIECITGTLGKNFLEGIDGDLQQLTGIDRLASADLARVQAVFEALEKAVAEKKKKKQPSFAVSKAKGDAKDPNAPKKPESAYLLFCRDARPRFAGMSMTDQSKALGEAWKALGTDKRSSYEEAANEAREAYRAAKAAYDRAHTELGAASGKTKAGVKGEGGKGEASERKQSKGTSTMAAGSGKANGGKTRRPRRTDDWIDSSDEDDDEEKGATGEEGDDEDGVGELTAVDDDDDDDDFEPASVSRVPRPSSAHSYGKVKGNSSTASAPKPGGPSAAKVTPLAHVEEQPSHARGGEAKSHRIGGKANTRGRKVDQDEVVEEREEGLADSSSDEDEESLADKRKALLLAGGKGKQASSTSSRKKKASGSEGAGGGGGGKPPSKKRKVERKEKVLTPEEKQEADKCFCMAFGGARGLSAARIAELDALPMETEVVGDAFE